MTKTISSQRNVHHLVLALVSRQSLKVRTYQRMKLRKVCARPHHIAACQHHDHAGSDQARYRCKSFSKCPNIQLIWSQKVPRSLSSLTSLEILAARTKSIKRTTNQMPYRTSTHTSPISRPYPIAASGPVWRFCSRDTWSVRIFT